MGFALPVLTLVTVALLANQAIHVDSEQNGMEEAERASLASNVAPLSFEERKLRRKRQAKVGQRNRIQPPGHKEGNTIMSFSIPNCVEEGMVLMQGHDNYFVKCIPNDVHGGFYRVIHLCPAGLHSVEDTTMCIPPPDCSLCGNGGFELDEMQLNGNEPTVSTVAAKDLGIHLGSRTASLDGKGKLHAQNMGHKRQQGQQKQNVNRMTQTVRKQAINRASKLSSIAQHRSAMSKTASSTSSHSVTNSQTASHAQSMTADQVESLTKSFLIISSLFKTVGSNIKFKQTPSLYWSKRLVANGKNNHINRSISKLSRLPRNARTNFTHFQKHEVASKSKTVHHRIPPWQDRKDLNLSALALSHTHHVQVAQSQAITRNFSTHENMSSYSHKHELWASLLGRKNITAYAQQYDTSYPHHPLSILHDPHNFGSSHIKNQNLTSSYGQFKEYKMNRGQTYDKNDTHDLSQNKLHTQKTGSSSYYGHHKEVANTNARKNGILPSHGQQKNTESLFTRKHELSSSYGHGHRQETVLSQPIKHHPYSPHGPHQLIGTSFSLKDTMSSYGNHNEQNAYYAQRHDALMFDSNGQHRSGPATTQTKKEQETSSYGHHNQMSNVQNYNKYYSPLYKQPIIDNHNGHRFGSSSTYGQHQKQAASNIQSYDAVTADGPGHVLNVAYKQGPGIYTSHNPNPGDNIQIPFQHHFEPLYENLNNVPKSNYETSPPFFNGNHNKNPFVPHDQMHGRPIYLPSQKGALNALNYDSNVAQHLNYDSNVAQHRNYDSNVNQIQNADFSTKWSQAPNDPYRHFYIAPTGNEASTEPKRHIWSPVN